MIVRLRRLALACTSLGAVLSSGARAGAPPPGAAGASPSREEAPLRRPGDVETAFPVTFEHHGYFRLRSELLLNGNLGARIGSIPEPLAARAGADEDASTLGWAGVRLRYAPTLRIGPDLAIHVGIDALDGLVLGSTHEGAGGLVAANGFGGAVGDSQASPSAGDFGWRDAVTVREAWAEVRLFDMVDVAAGRMPDQFGLGILRNAGSARDADGGTIVDRVKVGATLSDFRLEAAWEFTATGSTSELVSATDRGAGGQPKDLGQSDDVTTYAFRLGRWPTTMGEREARRALLEEKRTWAFDWALFSTFTDQKNSTSEPLPEASLSCRAEATLTNGQRATDADCIRLFPRNAFFWRPGAWFKAERRPDAVTHIRIEAEVGALIGSVEHPQREVDADIESPKEFIGFGGAIELEWQRRAWTFGLAFGFATGDNGRVLGVRDGQEIVDPNDDGFATNTAVLNNRTITSYVFNGDYRVDLLLFRQVIGSVTNAVYFKPWVARDIIQNDDFTLSLRLDALYAAAAKPSGTPGRGDQWGIEFDGQVDMHWTNGLDIALTAGLLIPLDALSDPETGKVGTPAFATRVLMGWRF